MQIVGFCTSLCLLSYPCCDVLAFILTHMLRISLILIVCVYIYIYHYYDPLTSLLQHNYAICTYESQQNQNDDHFQQKMSSSTPRNVYTLTFEVLVAVLQKIPFFLDETPFDWQKMVTDVSEEILFLHPQAVLFVGCLYSVYFTLRYSSHFFTTFERYS